MYGDGVFGGDGGSEKFGARFEWADREDKKKVNRTPDLVDKRPELRVSMRVK
jgi:hypothetical protein